MLCDSTIRRDGVLPTRRQAALLVCCLVLSGGGLAAAPCRVGSAALKRVPLVGRGAAALTDACAEVIDA